MKKNKGNSKYFLLVFFFILFEKRFSETCDDEKASIIVI